MLKAYRLLGVLALIGLAAAQSVGPTLSPALSLNEARLHGLITADRHGNIVLTGQSGDCSLPVVNPINNCGWLWIAKLDPTGSTILFATYFGPPKAPASVVSVQADGEGNIVVVSQVSDNSLPSVNALQPQENGSFDLHIFKLAADGSRVLYATYLGGSGFDSPMSLALDSKGAAYILIESTSQDFPTLPQPLTPDALNKWVVAKLSPDGQSLEYAASFPTVDFRASALQVDATGSVSLITGGEVLRIAPDGSALQRWPLPAWSSKLNPLLVPADGGGFWLAGTETNQSLPVTPDALQSWHDPMPYVRIENGQTLLPPTPMVAQRVSGFAIDLLEPWRIYAATDGGLFKSEDNGWTWASLFSVPCASVVIDPLDQNNLYLSACPGAMYRSTDRGQTWVTLAPPFIEPIAIDPKVPGLIYGPGYRSEDGGRTWQPFTIPQPVNGPCGSGCLFSTPVFVWSDPAQTGRIYVLAETRCTGFCPVLYSLLRSDDGGRTFASWRGFGNDLAVDPGTHDLFILGGGKITVYRNSSLDAAEVLNVPEVSAIAVDPSNSGTVYLALTDGFIIRSDDNGHTWNTVATVSAPAYLMTVSSGNVLNVALPPVLTNVFAFHFDGAGNVLYGTYFGGWNTTTTAAAVGPNGHLFLGGNTGSGLPVNNALQTRYAGGTDGFVAEFDANGTLLRSTYLGGAGYDQVFSLIPQDDGSVIVTGNSSSGDFLSHLQPSPIGGGNLFLVRLQP